MEYSECKTIDIHFDKGAVQLILNRPEKRNALNRKMISEIIEIIEILSVGTEYRVLIIEGANDYFCSGADLNWMKSGTKESFDNNLNDALLFEELYHQLTSFNKPVISVVKGGANGGALGLLACSDIVIADEQATFSLPEVKLGLIPAMVAPYIVKKIGISQAGKLMLTGEPISAQEAQNSGLVHVVTSSKNIKKVKDEYCQKIIQNAPAALSMTKNLLNNIANNHLANENLIIESANLIANARTSNEGQEGVNAFLEKRKPFWND